MEQQAAHLLLLVSPCLRREPLQVDLPDSAAGYLVAYLGVRGDWVRREEIATLMWPEASEDVAQHNLRVNLNRLRPLLRQWQIEDALVAEQRRLRLALPSDVGTLRAAHAAGDWLTAASIPHHGFLQSLSFRAFAVLGEWARDERTRLRELWRDALLRVAPQAPPATVLELARRYRATDPLDEDVLRIQLDALVATDQRSEARSVFRRYNETLREELGTLSSEALRDYAHRLLGNSTAQADSTTAAPAPAISRAVPRAVLQPPALIGRRQEKQLLVTGRERVVLLSGEAGAGKTRLLEEALPTACWIRCAEPSAQTPFAPLAAWLDDQRDALPPLDGELRELRRLLPTDDGVEVLPAGVPQEAAAKLMLAAASLIESFGGAVVFDDLQWIDPATAKLVMLLARRGRVRMVLAFRPAQIGRDAEALLAGVRDEIAATHALHLTPLSSEDFSQLLTNIAGASVDVAHAAGAWLFRRSSGNPFFALELLRSLFESGRLNARDPHWIAALERLVHDEAPMDLPPRLGELIRRRVRHLSDLAQRAIAVAALAGDCRRVEPLAKAAGVAPWVMAQALGEAAEAGLIDGQHFSHDLVREAISNGIPPSLAQLMHARVAEALADHLPPEAIAEHWWAADEPQHAIAATLSAFEHARARGLHAQSLPLLDRTLERELDSSWYGQLLAAKAMLQQELADAEGARRSAEAALAEALAPADRARALVVLARIAFQAGTLAVAIDLVTEAACSNADDSDLLRLRAQIAMVSGDSEQLLDALSAEVAALRRASPTPALISALTSLGAACDENGAPERGLPLHLEALALARRLNARSLQIDVAINLVWCFTALPGRTGEGFAIGEEALALGEYDASDTLRNNLAWAYADSGRLDEALTMYRRLTACRDPSLACVAWSKVVGLLAQLDAPGTEMETALEKTVQAMAKTDFYVAHASAMVAVLNYGDAALAARALVWLRPEQKVDPWLQQKLHAALASRNVEGAR